MADEKTGFELFYSRLKEPYQADGYDQLEPLSKKLLNSLIEMYVLNEKIDLAKKEHESFMNSLNDLP